MASKRITIWRILISRIRKHAWHHLIIPLVIGILFEGLVEVLLLKDHDKNISRIGIFWLHLFSFRTVMLIAGALLSYIVIMYSIISKETSVTNETEVTLKHLQARLKHANSYFGVSTIGLKEWFDPSMQVYLAKLLNRKAIPDHFHHERTLLFFSNREVVNFGVPFMDENHYGKSLAHIHRDSGIPISFLTRNRIFAVLDRLSEADKEALGCYPRWTSWRVSRFLRNIPLRWLRYRIKSLAFALVREGDLPVVLRISKSGEHVHIEEKRGEAATPYLRLEEYIKQEVYDGAVLKNDHNFVSVFALDPREQVASESLLHFFHEKIHPFTSGPYREDLVKQVSIDHAKAEGVYTIEETTAYKCRKGKRYIQDKLEWYIEKRSEADQVHEFKIKVTIPIEIFRTKKFRARYPAIHSANLSFEPPEETLTLPSGDTIFGYSFSLDKFKEIDGLKIETYVKYEGASNGHLAWNMSYPTKSLYMSVKYPADRRLNASLFGVARDNFVSHDDPERAVFSLTCDSWLLPTTGLLLGFCESKDETAKSDQKVGSMPYGQHISPVIEST
jgi:hypothetical protein